MVEYQMKDRRPISNRFRMMGYSFVDYCVEKKIHPNTISYFSMVFAILAGISLALAGSWSWLLLVAPLLGFGRLFCNMADGMVAIKAGVSSSKGEIVNELPDRISDTLIFLGLAFSGYSNYHYSYWVIFGMLAVSYIGVLGKAVGARRQFGGIMPKPARMFVLFFGCYLQFFYQLHTGNISPFLCNTSIIDIFNIIILVGLLQTAIIRTRRIFNELDAQK